MSGKREREREGESGFFPRREVTLVDRTAADYDLTSERDAELITELSWKTRELVLKVAELGRVVGSIARKRRGHCVTRTRTR